MLPVLSVVPQDARRVTIPALRLARWLDGFGERHGPLETSTDAAEATTVLVRAADGSRAWIEVPFPPVDLRGGRPLTALALHVTRRRRVGVLLVRRGGYAAGVFDGADLVASKVGSGYVQGTTKAGGWSQQRYARRRDNQARAAFGEAADVAVRILLPEAPVLQALFCGGDRPACDAVLADERLAPVAALLTGPRLKVGDPRQRVLIATPDQFRTVRIAVHP
jgi:hypothetical protein